MSFKYQRIITNVFDMLEARGDDVSQLREGDIVKFAEEVINAKFVLYSKDTAIIFYIANPALNTFFVKDSMMKNIDDIQGLVAAHENKKNYLLICSEKKVPANVLNTAKDKMKIIDKLLHSAYGAEGPAGFQLFEEIYLNYNPAKHELVPLHVKLTKEEAKRVKEIYNIKTVNGISQLPIISHTDIMARWLGLRHGDVVMITRNNPNSGTYYYYRICT